MPTAQYPRTLADLHLGDTEHSPSFYASLKSLRKSTLSIPNRLRSILADAEFAKQVATYYNLPLVANERCGSWYIDPANKAGSAYFKSTDGHHGQWDLSSRRLNLQLFKILAKHGGAVIVDSTRRGKNLPDAFSKTVPIWVAVVNRALFPELAAFHELQVPPPPGDLGLSEVSQIEARLATFTKTFRNLGLNLEALQSELGRPIQISWAINGHFGPDDGPRKTSVGASDKGQYHNLVLCSASRRVRGAEVSEGGYIQGAGDDNEAWSHGLTAPVFWAHRDLLMHTGEDDLLDLIKNLLPQSDSMLHSASITRIGSTNISVVGRLNHKPDGYNLIISCQGDAERIDPGVLSLGCRQGKLGSKDLREKLVVALCAAQTQLCKDEEAQVLVTCATGNDLSVGVAVAILCLLYDDRAKLLDGADAGTPDKGLVKRRLAWITTSKPDANPSRATLQAVNAFLMRRPD